MEDVMGISYNLLVYHNQNEFDPDEFDEDDRIKSFATL